MNRRPGRIREEIMKGAFDLRDGAGGSVPVLDRVQNGTIARAALISTAVDVLGVPWSIAPGLSRQIPP
jgi:hypothetical protein